MRASFGILIVSLLLAISAYATDKTPMKAPHFTSDAEWIRSYPSGRNRSCEAVVSSFLLWSRQVLADCVRRRTLPLSGVKGRDVVRVFIIAGRDVLLDAFADKLESAGCRVVMFDSAMTAIENSRDISPDLVITDFVLAGTTGVETAIRIREQVPDCAVLVVSGSLGNARYLAEAVVGIIGCVQNLKSAPIQWLDLNQTNNSARRLSY